MNIRLKKRRKDLGWTQERLAKIVGVDRSMISKIEAGGGCSMDLGIKLAKALGVTLDDLFALDNETSATKETA